jgi:parallel beta-helix repeat protein
MANRQILSVYLAIVMIITGFSVFSGASAQPDDGINGYQELHEDWIVTGYEEYTDEVIALFGDLTVQNGGHLVLTNCELWMMSQHLQPYDIIIEDGGIMEIYNGYITDVPDDDDTELLSAYYYFVAREGSTLIIEDSTVRQHGFIDLTNHEHLGLSISTNSGHITNSKINSTLIGLAFFGNNTGFFVENSNISQIGMTAIMLNDAKGAIFNNISFSETGESNVIDAQSSSDFIIENLDLQGEQFLRAEDSNGFEMRNIVSTFPERVLEIGDCDDFKVQGVDIIDSTNWNRRISVDRSTNFTFDDINANDDNQVMFFGECSYGSISNLTGSNITWMIDAEKSHNITVTDVNIGGNGNVIRFSDSKHITMDRINIDGGTFPIYFDTVNESSISNISLTGLTDEGVTIRDYSYNISVTNAYMETNSMTFTIGVYIDFSFDVYVNNLTAHNLNISLLCRDGSVYAENINIYGTVTQKYGIRLTTARDSYLSNVSIFNKIEFGIYLWNSFADTSRLDNIYMKDAETGIMMYHSNATIDNITIDTSINDLLAEAQSIATIKNSTVANLYMMSSNIICINTINTTAAIFSGPSRLIRKWWVDVYVSDKSGPIAGATVYVLDGSLGRDAVGITGPDGFVRNLAATDVIWTSPFVADNRNPHKTEANGPGWFADNLTFYQVERNMWVNVTYNGDAPPWEPTNLMSHSDEMSNTVLTWEPSRSLDVQGYNIYIAKSWSDLWDYFTFNPPNASVTGNTFTHLGGSSDWQKFLYGVSAYDNENESVSFISTELGDWVVNSTSPQFIQNENFNLFGSLLVYGQLDLQDTTFSIYSPDWDMYGIFVNNSGSLITENFKLIRSPNDPYYFKIGPDAFVNINNSEIQQPGVDSYSDDWTEMGIFSLTKNLTITNSRIDVMYGGLGIYNVVDFNGLFYNVSFTTLFVPEQAEYLISVMDSDNLAITNCSLEGNALYGIYVGSSSNISITGNTIQTYSFTQGPAWGVFFISCADSQIYDNPLLKGVSAIYILFSMDITVQNSNISGHSLYGIHVESSWYTTITECYFDTNDDPDIGIYMSWCRESTIRDMESAEVNYFLVMENESVATVENINITSGDMAITVINSEFVLMKDVYINFIQNGMRIVGGREITLNNVEINLTLNGLEVKSAGPIYLINSTLANCISGELFAEGFHGEAGNLIFENSTIAPIGDNSFTLNNSAVVHLINTPFNLSKLKIEDGASRLEIYHYLSVQVYDIDNNIPTFSNITIANSKEDRIYDETVLSGYAEWILIHEKTVFRDNTYLDNPHKIYVFDGSHLGMAEVFINYSQHIDVQVSNQFPIITLIGLYGFTFPADFTLFPTTKYDIVLDYTYEDPEGDPEFNTTIHWYINGIYNASFDNQKTITPQYTQKGQLWQAYVYPSDGYDSTWPTFAFESNIIPIINTPPEISNVTITPIDPTGGNDLFIDFEVFDLDDDGLDSAKTTSRWFRWNEGLNDYEYSSIDSFYLPSQYTAKGEKWICRVTPHDGDAAGMMVQSQEVIIGNTPPSIQNVRITSESGSAIIDGADNLKVQYIFLDSDMDLENGTAYFWEYQRAGGPWIPVNVNSSIIPNSYTQREDLWRCKVIPKDNEDFGGEAWTDAVEIFNTPPLVSNISINPQFPTSSDSLEVTYDFFDYDGDSDNGTSFRWVYEDALGSYESGIHGNVTPKGVLVKEQTWYCFVIPSDGINSGQEVRSDGILILNSAPAVSEAEIEISQTDLDTHFELIYDPEDIDGDLLTSINISWYRNGILQSNLKDNTTVSEDNLVKDDSWYAIIRLSDGIDWSEWFMTSSTIVPNNPPEIIGTPTLSPSKANSSEDLTPSFQSLYSDQDGDLLSSWEIWWYRDNGHMEDYDDFQEIHFDLTEKGEIWYYKVRVSDGEDFSDWFSSTTTLIENSPPSNVILNQTVATIIMIENDDLEFQASADDNDGDILSFRWILSGRIVQFDEGISNSIYFLQTDYDWEDIYFLQLVISDGEDTFETTWKLDVKKKNRLPKIAIVEPESTSASIKEKETLDFAITKSDADGDDLEVKWYVDGVLVYEGSDKFSFTPDYSSIRNRVVTAEVIETDFGENSTVSWDIAVADVDVSEAREELLGLSYDAWGLIMALISGLAAIMLFLFGFYRVRKKKGRLKEHMVEMDEILSQDEDADVIEDRLVEFEDQIREEFSQGKLEDLHFLMLNEIIASRKGEVRKAEVTQKFGRLPKSVLQDLDKMLEDGNITKEEYEDFIGTISKSESLSPAQKKELSKMIGEWEAEDKDGEGGEDGKDSGDTKEESKEDNEKEATEKEDEKKDPPPPPPEEAKDKDDEKIAEIISSINGEENKADE